jgi:ferredoxin
MSHHTIKSSYHSLTERLNRFPQGAPPTELLYKILSVLMSEREAGLLSLVPIKPFTAKKAAEIWKMELTEAKKVLEDLASRGILVDVERKGDYIYTLPPPMAGFFEFSLMRIRTDIDQKLLSELFYQYLNVEEDFIKELFTRGKTQLGRVFVQERVLTNDNALQVLDYERASEVIKKASYIGVGVCYCRHKMSHLGKACSAPMEICMTFNSTAASLTRHNIARRIDAVECLDLLQKAQSYNLVQFGENVQKRVGFICNCCGCCCEAMITARKFGFMHPVHTTNYISELIDGQCNGCGKCVNVCPVEAMTLVSANDPHHPKMKKAKLDENICLGCGVCVKNCDKNLIQMKPRKERIITPLNSVHKTVIMAVERGKLQNLIFDNRVLFSHRALAAVLGVILKLSPIKQLMATRQMKSRYLEALVRRVKV